jgi:uncharacterized membrane protein YoaK (UPF0700 family)
LKRIIAVVAAETLRQHKHSIVQITTAATLLKAIILLCTIFIPDFKKRDHLNVYFYEPVFISA